MATKVGERRGNKPLKKVEPLTTPEKATCLCCNNEFKTKDMYKSRSPIYRGTGIIPYCKTCLGKLFDEYQRQYVVLEYQNPHRKAMDRVCMLTDLYYSDKVYDSAMKDAEKEVNAKKHFIESYVKQTNMYQYLDKDYNTTIYERYGEAKEAGRLPDEPSDKTEEELEIIVKSTKIFGKGYLEDDYLYLYDQYEDWLARYECNTKAQEEVFKRLSCLQLEIMKATRRGDDTAKLDEAFRKYMDTGNIAPKQNAKDAISDAQTFGTLIDKWENTRPLPEIDEDLRDVDKIGKYIRVFFAGHLAKMLGVNNAYTDEYDEVMTPLTVTKPEYSDVDDEDDELFDLMFGHQYVEGGGL